MFLIWLFFKIRCIYLISVFWLFSKHDFVTRMMKRSAGKLIHNIPTLMYKMIASTVDYSHNREDCSDTMHLAKNDAATCAFDGRMGYPLGVGVTAAQK